MMKTGMSAVETRSVYRQADLRRLLEPRVIAVVGATDREQAMGARACANLSRFKGVIYHVNPRIAELYGQRCHASLSDLPEVPDCVVVAVARDQVEPVVAECAALGVGGVVVFAANYAETGDAEGARLQAGLVEISRRNALRIVGPNTIGVANLLSGACATFAKSLADVLAAEDARDPALQTPRIGLVSQSGGIGFSLALAAERGVAFSHVLTTGNSCDIDVADFIAYLAEDPGCRAIACLFESIPDPDRLRQAAEIAWEADKPLLICKIATGSAGAEAALSHSGMLAGSNAAFQALFKRTGVIAVDALEDLVETAGFFARVPARVGPRGVAVATSSGGLAVICADKAEHHGVSLPPPSAATHERLQVLIPDFGSPRNPCDVTAQVQTVPTMLAAAGEAFLAEPEYGTLVVTHAIPYGSQPRMQALDEMAARHDKMLVHLWTCAALERPEVRFGETLAHGAVMRSADRCFAAIRAWHARDDLRRAGRRDAPRLSAPDAAPRAAALIGAARDRVLTEREAKQVLACYGVPVTRERLARNRDEALAVWREFGGPVVLKVESPDLPHKTEADVIRLGLGTADEVSRAWDEVMANAQRVAPPPRIHGVLVQQMVPQGVEVMIGARIDPVFGPLVLTGLGGILVELMNDVAVGLAPIGRAEARSMLQGLKGAALLRGFRGRPAVDIDQLAEVVARVSEFVADQRGVVAELDVNPLICSRDKVVAVDALIVRAST